MNPNNTVLQAFHDHASTRPDAPALSAADHELSYGELAELVEDGARRLARFGIEHGDRVVIAGDNTLGWVVAFLAVLRCGAIAVPLHTRLGADQLSDILEPIEPGLVLHDPSIIEPPAADHPWPTRTLGTDAREALTSLEAADPTTAAPPRPQRSDIALIAFTSGTTSAPKGAVIDHGALMDQVRVWQTHSGAGPGWTTTVLVPLFHNTAYSDQILHALAHGGALDIPGRYRTDTAIAAMIRRPPTFLVMVPAMARMLIDHPDADAALADCRLLGVGGAALPAATAVEMQKRWPDMAISHGYGLTEFTSLSHILPPELITTHPDSVGLPVADVECSIRDEVGDIVPTGEIGEVWLAGPQRMTGYWKNPRATAEALHGRWLRTGDLGRVDENGLLWLQGRRSTTINRGGEKISPEAVEAVIASHPAVAHVCVVGIAHDVLGETVAAAVVPTTNADFDADQIRTDVGSRLPDYAWPDRIRTVDELPLASTGKIDRTRIAELLLQPVRTGPPPLRKEP